MLSLRQFLLMKLTEECAEVSQRAAKQIQFGTNQTQATDYEFFGGTDRVITDEMRKTNANRLRDEIKDLFSLVSMLTEIGEISDVEPAELLEAYEAKKKKLLKYGSLSVAQGELDPTALGYFFKES